MTDRLRPDTSEEIRILCRKISVAHDLDAEIQEELHGHMEDKLIAYLDGEEALAEEDAFILVREHFGNPSAVKGLLRDVHAYEADVSLARRLAAALIVTVGANIVRLYLSIAVLTLWPAAHGIAGPYASYAVTVAVAVVFPWLLLWHWQRRLDAGHTPWFLTWRPAYLVGSITALSVLHPLLKMGRQFESPVSAISSGSVLWLMVVALVGSSALQCTVWIWWCDRPPRKARAVSAAAGLWVAWNWSSSCIGAAVWWASASNTALLSRIPQSLGIGFALMALCALIGLTLYWMARHAAAGLTRWSAARR